MNDFDERVRHQLKNELESVRSSAGAWSQIESRVNRRTTPWARVVAGAAIVILGAGLAVNLRTDPGDPRVTATETSTTTTDDSASDGSSRSTTSALPLTIARPRLGIGITATGELVSFVPGDGQGLTVLVRLEPDPVVEGQVASFINGFDVDSDRSHVLYSVCCEPAPGSTLRVSLEGGGSPELVADGSCPSVAPDGGATAIGDGGLGLKLHRTDGSIQVVEQLPELLGQPICASWSPDATQLVIEVATESGARLFVLPASATSLAEAREITVPSGTAWSSPAWRDDDTLLVVASSGGGAALVSIATDGTSHGAVDIDGRQPVRVDTDDTGAWALITTDTGELVMLDPNDRVDGVLPLGLAQGGW